MQWRNALNSASVCGSLTQLSHVEGISGSPGKASHGYADAAIGSRAAAELQRHGSARPAKPARTGFRSSIALP